MVAGSMLTTGDKQCRNTKHLYPVMVNGIRIGDRVVSIKDVVQSSVKVPEFDKHLKKRYGNNNNDVDNSKKNLNDIYIYMK